MTSGLETKWDYSGRKERDGQKKKIVKATEKREKWKRAKDEEGNGQGGKGGAPDPCGAISGQRDDHCLLAMIYPAVMKSCFNG